MNVKGFIFCENENDQEVLLAIDKITTVRRLDKDVWRLTVYVPAKSLAAPEGSEANNNYRTFTFYGDKAALEAALEYR